MNTQGATQVAVRSWFWVATVALVALILPAATLRAADLTEAEIANRRCANCHGQSRIATLNGQQRTGMVAPTTQPLSADPRPELHVTSEALDGSVHAGQSCVSCHTDAETLPHKADLKSPTCGAESGCHTGPVAGFMQGSHAEALAAGNPSAPTCATCHGDHQILKATDRKSPTNPLNVVQICGDCHAKYTEPTTNGRTGDTMVAEYLGSVHGQAVTKGGMSIAATCADCHDAHRVQPSTQPTSTVNRANIADTCGQCHTGLSEKFSQSVHGELLAKGDDRGPVCSDCHTAHRITATDKPDFLLDIVAECGTCHESLYDTYRKSYHGQVTDLGSTRGARCADCHGAHEVKRVNAPDSLLNAEHKVETCRKCHPDATANFAGFYAHGDHRDGSKYPILFGVWLYFVVMMSFAFGFFGLHSVLWFIRGAIERFKRGPVAHHGHHKGPSIQRFNRIDRINHALVIISFFGLTLTGLPLLYADKQWGKTLAAMLGGVPSAGILHRIFAVMLILNFVIHGVGVVQRIRKHGLLNLVFGPASMLPKWKDLTDCIGMFKWFFRGGKKPKFDRWTYWEKFDYVAEVGGSGIIGVTGLILWFPEFFGRFLPGWMFNVATLVHGYEALLAIGFIFTIHFFNAHLRLEKFPVDDVMFTGRLPEEEFKEEREAEYERLVEKGELDALKVAPPPSWYRWFAVILGMLAMAIGTTLVVLIVLAGIGVL
jgi:cytochrome b subunit of formate dehydrogenase